MIKKKKKTQLFEPGYWTLTLPKQTAGQISVNLCYIRGSELGVIMQSIELNLCLVLNDWDNEDAQSVERKVLHF